MTVLGGGRPCTGGRPSIGRSRSPRVVISTGHRGPGGAALVAPERPIVPVGVAVGVVAAWSGVVPMLRRWAGRTPRRKPSSIMSPPPSSSPKSSPARPARACAGRCRWPCRRLLQLLAIGHDDAGVVLGVLQIVLCQHRVAGRLRVARERQIFLGDMCRRAPDFHIRAIGFEAARQRIVALSGCCCSGRAHGDFAVLASLP